MKKYYNIHATLPENLGTVSFALHTDENFGKYLLAVTRIRNELPSCCGDLNSLRVAIYYHMADYLINQHTTQLAHDPTAPTVLNTFLDVLKEIELYYCDDEDNCAAYWIEQGMIANSPSLLRKGLFQAFILYLDMIIRVEPKAHTKCSAASILEFDSKTCVEQFKKNGEKECYSVQININDCNGDQIEEFYECPIYIHPYLGEMMLADSGHDLEEYAGEFYGGLIDALKWKAAVMLFEEHKCLKETYPQHYADEDKTTPLENFWAMALEEGEVDEEEYEEIMSDINDTYYIERIYEIIDNRYLLSLEDFYRAPLSDKDNPHTTDYED